jgi:DNA-binding winged helix-turn-helix (wHTH) protein
MGSSQNFLHGKARYLYGLMLLLFISVICAAFNMADSDDFAMARREILLRRIGHELLLQSGDSTSKVLPIKKIAKNEYQISFQNELTFQADSLVNTTQRLLAQDPVARGYVVTVLNSDKSVAYGYAISENKKDDIISCIGRKQAKANYVIAIKFEPTDINILKKEYLLGTLPFLAFVGFIILRPVKPRQVLPNGQNTGVITLGSILFDAKNRKLIVNGKTIELTGTETRVLSIFALTPNETIERSRLQKEIWEDEGVIVGRSLDMFISKLRKKLEPDPNINIIVVRGKGYKLEISV